MLAHESNVQTGISASNDQSQFAITIGGLYQVAAVDGTWGGGSAVLEQLNPDGLTWLTISTPITADGGQQLYLPPGGYRWTVATATGLTLSVVRIPH